MKTSYEIQKKIYHGTEISIRRSSIKNDPRNEKKTAKPIIEAWDKREFPFLGLAFSRWEAKQLKSLARVNLVQLSLKGEREREIRGFAVILRRFAMSSPPSSRINAANHAAII